MADYATVTQVKAAGRLNITGTTYDADLTKLLTAASRWIDQETWGITDAFKATVASVRYFDASVLRNGVLHLNVPLLSVTSLTNGNGVALATGAYKLLPRNSPHFWQIGLLSTNMWQFTEDGEIAVNGVWGYSATVPEQVEEATLMLAGWMFKRWQQALQDRSANMEMGEMVYNAAIPATVRELLRHVMRGPSI